MALNQNDHHRTTTTMKTETIIEPLVEETARGDFNEARARLADLMADPNPDKFTDAIMEIFAPHPDLAGYFKFEMPARVRGWLAIELAFIARQLSREKGGRSCDGREYSARFASEKTEEFTPMEKAILAASETSEEEAWEEIDYARF